MFHALNKNGSAYSFDWNSLHYNLISIPFSLYTRYRHDFIKIIVAVIGCHVVRVTDLYGCILNFLDWSRYFFFQVALQLYSRGWANPVPDPLLLRKSGSAGNRTWTSGSVARNSDH
jgi:hypothetical protein